MIDLSVPSEYISLFNFKQFVKKDGKNTFKYIFLTITTISLIKDKGKLRMFLLIMFKKLSLFFHPSGYDLFVCPNCGNETIVAHTCSSRYCTKCGSKSSQRRAAYVSSMAFKSKHRHIVFNPAQLRGTLSKTDHCLMVFLSLPEILASLFNDRKYRRQKRLEKERYLHHKKKKYT